MRSRRTGGDGTFDGSCGCGETLCATTMRRGDKYWRARANVQSWMLFNYCLALRHLGRYEEAGEVARHVVQEWPHREGSGDMRLFLAVESALEGSIPEAEEHLRLATVRRDVGYDVQIQALTRALVEFWQTPQSERRKRFAGLRDQLDPQFGSLQLATSMRDMRRTFRRAGEVFVREGAGPLAWIWFKRKQYWQWTLPFLVTAFIYILTQTA
jgi:hypothetical protein